MNWGRNTNTYSPRIGIAYQVRPNTVLRGGYGRSFDIGVFGSIFGHAATQNLPVLSSQEINATGGPLSQAFSLASGPLHRLHPGTLQRITAEPRLRRKLTCTAESTSASNSRRMECEFATIVHSHAVVQPLPMLAIRAPYSRRQQWQYDQS